MSEKPTETGSEGLPKRWSAGRKAEVVVRMLRGEDIGEASREIRVPPPELERWRRKWRSLRDPATGSGYWIRSNRRCQTRPWLRLASVTRPPSPRWKM